MKTYNKFVDYYNDIIRGNGYDLKAEVSFLDETMSEFGDGKEVLELACGTGTIAKELGKKGYTVTGVDLSEQMIQKAGKGDFQVGDMTSANLDDEFDVVLCNYNSVCHLPDWEAWIAFFENAHKHLKKDGILIFDILTLFEFENIARDYRGFFNIHGDTVCLEMFKEKQYFRWLIKMFVKQDESNYKLVEEEIKEISFPISKIKKCLEKTGFTVEHSEDFHFGEVTVESERVYFVAKK